MVHQSHVPAPITFDIFCIQIYPDCRAASCYHQLRAQVTLLTVHDVTYVVYAFHPVAGCNFCTLSSCFFVCMFTCWGPADDLCPQCSCTSCEAALRMSRSSFLLHSFYTFLFSYYYTAMIVASLWLAA
jgi:hypothetical protein